MLDQADLLAIQNHFTRAVNVVFHCFVGPSELFKHAIEAVSQHLKNVGQTLDLSRIDVADIDRLVSADPPPSCVFLSGLPGNNNVLKRINLRREVFIKNGIILIFLFTPAEWRKFTELSNSISPFIIGKTISLGPQHTLDDMGDPLQDRLLQLLERIDKNEEVLNHLINRPPATLPNALIILRRWNSFSPILSWRPSESVKDAELAFQRRIRREIRGGGYLLKWQGVGIVVDPGHNFIENLYEQGYSIADIDAVVISHDHLDHTADFESIIDLLYQCNKRGHTKKISVFLNPTTFIKYQNMLKKNTYIQTYKNLDPEHKTYRKISNKIRINVIRAQHKELGGLEDALSLRFDLYSDKKGRAFSAGFTADTGWHQELGSFFRDVDLLVAHLGSVRRFELEEAKFYKFHLGILGVFKLLKEIEKNKDSQTVILSEFGEELGGLRDILGSELIDKFPGMKIIPGDIGHTVKLESDRTTIVCDHKECEKTVMCFFEQDGEIRIRCDDHKPTLGVIENR
ncbi:MAG: MBL fold metallo-hydrolase [Desulfobacterales bacterium]|nr:MBL fold metallo-hydrolase [Desulfobacterales bacterium]